MTVSMRKLSISSIATQLLNLLTSTRDRGFADRVRWKALSALRQILLRFGDPIARYQFCGSELLVPLSHELPIIRRDHPIYSDNVGRIAAYLYEELGSFRVIDIGANVGDTVAIIHRHAQVPMLCVEGEPKFAELLKLNAESRSPRPEIAIVFIAASARPFTSVMRNGTARLEPSINDDPQVVATKSFDEVLNKHPGFQDARLLKIDTDGMDVAILNAAIDWISVQKPVLFFEYDPDLQTIHDENGLALLRRLRETGYHRALVYENVGDYMFSAELENETLLCELHQFFSGRRTKRYCDLCIFHRQDDDIAEKIRQKELEFFRTMRPPVRSTRRGL